MIKCDQTGRYVYIEKVAGGNRLGFYEIQVFGGSNIYEVTDGATVGLPGSVLANGIGDQSTIVNTNTGDSCVNVAL